MQEKRGETSRRPVTRDDVARYAGVSSAVVSYVVNNGPRHVAQQTEARVRAAIELLGYRPNLSARALKGGTTRTLGLVLSDMVNPYFAEFALQIRSEAAAAGYAVLMADSTGAAATENAAIHDLISRQVDGILISGSDAQAAPMTTMRQYGIPSLLVDCPDPVVGYPTIGSDAVSGARLAVEHLIEVHGHELVALVIGEGTKGADAREQGWQAATREAGLADGPIARGPFSREGGYAAGFRLLSARNPPAAIFASSDLQGVGVLRAAHELGMRVPEDIAVVAFDGSKEAEYTWPPMTTAQQPVREMAVRAVRRLLEPQQLTDTHDSFPIELIVRQSCGTHPATTTSTASRPERNSPSIDVLAEALGPARDNARAIR